MSTRHELVGREAEFARLQAALAEARTGRGSLLLVAGEAGVGKTRLTSELATATDGVVLHGGASQAGTAPYAPLAAAFRGFLRVEPHGLSDCGPLQPHLALILPELGAGPAATDRPTLFEAVRCAFARIAARGHALVLLDDLQWSDEATLELLSAIAPALRELPVLVVGAYRSDGLPRDHGVRRLRNELRRAGHLEELVLSPLDLDGTAALLSERLGTPPSPELTRAIHDRTEGVPFFVEELGTALVLTRALAEGRKGVELAGGEIPIPETIRDAVLIGAAELSEEAQAAADVAAVAGDAFDLELVGALAGHGGLAELVEQGMLREDGTGGGRFRHALAREVLYSDVPWLRRRALHRRLAEAMQEAGAPSREIAGHWQGAREDDRAREALLRAAAEAEAVHAYRDAAAAGRQALESWPAGVDEWRVDALERYARCCHLAGALPEAARGWQEAAGIRRATGDHSSCAEAGRNLAAVLELRGDREAAFAARREAAEVFAAVGRPAEAAVEQLAMANYRRLAAHHGEAIAAGAHRARRRGLCSAPRPRAAGGRARGPRDCEGRPLRGRARGGPSRARAGPRA